MMRKELLPFVWTPDEDEKKTKLDKRTFKICEAVALGLKCYYMGPNDKRMVTEDERKQARKIIRTLPNGWMQKKYEWQVFGKKKDNRKVMQTDDEDDGGYIISKKEAERLFSSLKEKSNG